MSRGLIISTSGMLIRELKKVGDDFITVKLGEKEYVIESIGREKSHFNTYSAHLCLNIRDGGDGNIKR